MLIIIPIVQIVYFAPRAYYIANYTVHIVRYTLHLYKYIAMVNTIILFEFFHEVTS